MIWDYIVIGAGSAGCAVAYELVTAPGSPRVLLLEAGSDDRSLFIRVPGAQSLAVRRHDWGYTSEPDPDRGGASDFWLRGKVVGGSSSINGTMYVRGTRSDFDRWAAACGAGGDSAWAGEAVARLFDSFERRDGGNGRRNDGQLSVKDVRHPHAITRAFVASAEACDIPFNPDYNGLNQEGVSFAQLSQRRGFRCSSADAFLRPIRRRPNFRLVVDAHVDRLEIEDGKVTAVRYTRAGRAAREQATNVVLCGGAIASPKLLMLSGVGDARELSSLGIKVQRNIPHVGRNLREHPLVKLTYDTTIPTFNPTEGLFQKMKFGLDFLLKGEGPLANIFEAAAFLRSRPSEPAPDIQLHFLPIGYVAHEGGGIAFAPVPSATILVNKSYPVSSGAVLLRSSDPADAPIIRHGLLDSPEDVATLVDGVQLARSIMTKPPIANLVRPTPAIAALTDRAAVEAYVRSSVGLAFHPMGTCRMGGDKDSVVDCSQRVRGISNLWIADASIFPTAISGNTNAAAIMVGAQLGRFLARRGGTHPCSTGAVN